MVRLVLLDPLVRLVLLVILLMIWLLQQTKHIAQLKLTL